MMAAAPSRSHGVQRAERELLPDDVRQTFGDWLYWNVELRA
jgi:hypothetical protein